MVQNFEPVNSGSFLYTKILFCAIIFAIVHKTQKDKNMKDSDSVDLSLYTPKTKNRGLGASAMIKVDKTNDTQELLEEVAMLNATSGGNSGTGGAPKFAGLVH